MRSEGLSRLWRASVRPQNTVTYSASNGGPKNCGFFSEISPSEIITAIRTGGPFPAESAHAHYSRAALVIQGRWHELMAPSVLHFNAFILYCNVRDLI